MYRRVLLAFGVVVFACFSGAMAADTPRPNIIIVLSDDMGYSDLGCYGGEIQTPNLDALAAGGLRFTQFYNGARCCPTRACLLTGLYAHQAGVGHMTFDFGVEGYRGELNRNCVTIAEALKPAGYSTYAVGKWHVTAKIRPTSEADKHNWPLQRGFERYYGTLAGAGSFYDPNALVRDNALISPYADPEYKPKQFYYTNAITDHAVRFIAEHKQRAADKPFFLYVAYTAAHWPMHALDQDIAKYHGRYDRGYEAIRLARLEKARRLGLIDPKWPMTPRDADWNTVANKAWESRCMEVYAAMIDCMDQGIGRIVGELKKQGQFDNTLVLFLQDNGACAEDYGHSGIGKPRADAPSRPPMKPEQLQFDTFPRQSRDGYPVRRGQGAMPGPADTYISYGQGWANVSNTPFREYKHWVHEGGISTPLVAHWPKGIAPERRNQLAGDPGHLVDLMATCVDLAGAKYPTELGGQKIQPMEGVSLRPVFDGKPLTRPQPIFWEHEGNRAVRQGQWKLVAKENQPWELYDMEADRTELNNLAATHPEKVKELSAQWDAWAGRAKVLPLDAWRTFFKPAAKSKQRKKG